MNRIDYRLYLVTDDPSRYEGDWIENVVAAVAGGVTCVQYRDTESDRKTQFDRIMRLKDALNGKGAAIIVNNDAELAVAVKADGVHVGQGDSPPEEVRQIVGPDVEIGLSITCLGDLEKRPVVRVSHAHVTPAEFLDRRAREARALREAEEGGQALVSVYGIGPVYDARKTKRDAAAAMGCEGLREIVSAVRGDRNVAPAKVQTVAIGGITLDRAADVVATGVDGLAVVSAFSKAADPFEVARQFRLASA